MSPKEKDFVACPKCGKPAWKPGKVRRTGKNPLSTFWYLRYKHPRRYGRNQIHYVRLNQEVRLTDKGKAVLHTVIPEQQPVRRKVRLPKEDIDLTEVEDLEKAIELKQKERRLKSVEA